jgi:hypothetical protein
MRKIQHSTSFSARCAAKYPHIPCTPTPGGVADEQMYTPLAGVEYRLRVGRVKNCRRSTTPAAMSPPTRLGLWLSISTGDIP